MKNNKSIMIVISVSTLIIIMTILWFTGVTGLLLSGMSYIGNNTNKFHDTGGYLMPEEYSISINLTDLQSNIGKELYNDGESKIYVSWIDNTESLNTGGYRIGFRSSGKYSLNGATLVSGARHETVDYYVSKTYMTAKMTTTYNDIVYDNSVAGTTGLSYKDGDEFSFYMFPTEAYENEQISFEENGIAEVTIKNLHKNIWTKK